MLSTPSSQGDDTTYDDDTLFPGATSASTSNAAVAAQVPANDHLNAAAPGELSPPRSQSNTQSNGFSAPPDAEDFTDDDEGVDVKGDKPRVGQDDKNKPGAGWKNKKAQEDMQRSWDYIVDKDFDIKQYGDPLAGKQR